MPKRSDIESILVVGAGPIVIGQACEFDYSGTQACKALAEEGFRVVLVNSNPATIMTDPGLADATYIEPVHWKVVARIIEKERPDALLPTMGGQTGLNCSLDLAREGVLEAFGVELVGASREAIDKAEDRERFRAAMARIGLECPRAAPARDLEQAVAVQADVGFPTIVRPSFTLGGTGGGIAYNREEFVEICERGLEASPTTEVSIEESVLGWKEFEMEVVRDRRDNCIVVCSIENLDPMGVHTGDSITVAPAQTLTDKEYQRMRDASVAVLREIGVDTGGSNVQFAIDPADGRMVVIEMNPRVSRSSALASKATGFPIARVAAKLAVGYTLGELGNEITGGVTPASFEPSIDYVVTKVPRFDFEKFPRADARLTTQMKSVGEAMALGRTFQESLQKALRSLDTGLSGLDEIVTADPGRVRDGDGKSGAVHRAPSPARATGHRRCDGDGILGRVRRELREPGPQRLRYLADALRLGMDPGEAYRLSRIDPWFIAQIADLVDEERALAALDLDRLDAGALRRLKRKGFSDARIATLIGAEEGAVRTRRERLGVHPVFKRVDSCAAEFRAATAYMYSTYEEECESEPSDRRKIVVLGGGPNRIGQGIEFDYCCVQAAFAMRQIGYESIMVNCNPETVSTDYDTSDRLYFEPLTLEDVLEIVRVERPEGVIVQYGGQTPAQAREGAGGAGGPDRGDQPGQHRSRRGPRALPAIDRGLRAAPAPRPHRPDRRRGGGAGGGDRLPPGRAPLLRARRAGDGDRLRRGRPPGVHGAGGGGLARLAGAARPLPRRRGRGRRRLRERWRGGVHRRHHGAYRAGRDPLRGLRVLAAPGRVGRRHASAARRADPDPRPGARRGGPDERPVRDQGRDDPRAGSQSPGIAHGALRLQGDRRAAREDRGAVHGRTGWTPRPRPRSGARRRTLRGEGSGVPLHQAPGCGLPAWSGDEIDRRGDGGRGARSARRSRRRCSRPGTSCRRGEPSS